MKSYLDIQPGSAGDHAAGASGASKLPVAYEKVPSRKKNPIDWPNIAKNPLAVRKDYPRRKKLQADLTRYYDACLTSPSARKFRGERRKSYCAGVAWKRLKSTGRYDDYFAKDGHPMAKKSGGKKKGKLKGAAKAAFLKKMAAGRRKAERKRTGHGGSKKKPHRSRETAPASTSAAEKHKHGDHGGGHRKNPKRVAAGKKAARTRKRNAAGEITFKNEKRNKADGEFRSTRKPGKNKKTGKTYTTGGKIRQSAAHKKLKAEVANYKKALTKNRKMLHGLRAADNPIDPLDLLGASAGTIAGFGVAYLVDDIIATNSVTQSGSGTSATSTQLVTAGKIDNEFAIDAPLWSDWKRALAAGVLIVAPWAGSMLGAKGALKTGLQVVGLGTTVRTVLKLGVDIGAKLLGGTAIGQRLFAPQINAQNRIAWSKAAAALSPAKQEGQTTQTVPNTTPPATNPYAAVGAGRLAVNRQMGAGHVCVGNGACGGGCGACQAKKQKQAPPPPPATAAPTGAAKPSASPEVTTTATPPAREAAPPPKKTANGFHPSPVAGAWGAPENEW